ncbi:MAG TPA: cation:proton antiporter [Longimicrobiaceae bacterium]|nr:cation:proton antiporter [Longimicrobiaceae bacterium]
MPFTAAPHHDVLVLIFQIALLLLSARALGELAQRLGQPSVVGEILAGIILGPSLLSGLVPALGAWIVPEAGVPGYLLESISLLGALFLLLITGLETDLALIRRHARTAIGVSLGGIIVTFTSGFFLGQLLPDRLLADADQRLVFALFVATAMSISAIPVIAKVLMDLNLMRRDIGQTIIAAGMSDDTIGWVLLSIVAGLASVGEVTAGAVGRSVGSVLLFMVASFTIGRWLVKRALDYVQDEIRASDRLVTLVVVMTLAWGALTQALGLEAVLGAFVMGILFGQMPRLPNSVHQKLGTLSLAVFTPIFFAVAGLKVNIRSLLEPELMLLTVAVILVASVGKVVGTYVGARVIGGREHWTALSFGAGLNARGAMEIIIATIGLELGILSQDMFSIIVVMAMATSLMAPPALRWVLAHVQPEQQELDRLRQEELAAKSVISKIHRVLLPVRRRPSGNAVHGIEAYVLERMANDGLAVTLFNVSEEGGKARSTEFLETLEMELSGVDVTRKVVESGEPADVILEEAQKHYDLMILGATETASATALFHPMVDQLVRMVPCPTLVVKGRLEEGRWPPRRILVPTNGSAASRAAADLAFVFASGDNPAEVVILNAVQQQHTSSRMGIRNDLVDRHFEAGVRIVNDLQEIATARGVTARTEVREAPDAESVILGLAMEESMDLIILGTDVRPGSGRLFLGPRVERILHDSPCPVLVLNI